MPIYWLLFMLLLPPAFAAQQSGMVRSSDQAIPGATVTATQGDKKIVTTSDESGQYVFKDLPAGAWTLQVDMFGFTAARREVTVGHKPGTIDWTLELKPRSEPSPISTRKPSEPRPVARPSGSGQPPRSASSPRQHGRRPHPAG